MTAVSARPGGPQCTPAGSPRRSKPTYESTYCRKAGAGRAPIPVAVWSSIFVSVRAAQPRQITIQGLIKLITAVCGWCRGV
ncbi:hypothetical protein GCM10010277_81700 [Streptomyces longisporoflavus]|nr:hypothetical protein GCM10010277_81700 [Streptomyces longisporoflavus]